MAKNTKNVVCVKEAVLNGNQSDEKGWRNIGMYTCKRIEFLNNIVSTNLVGGAVIGVISLFDSNI